MQDIRDNFLSPEGFVRGRHSTPPSLYYCSYRTMVSCQDVYGIKGIKSLIQ
jgi:hypothetical protein